VCLDGVESMGLFVSGEEQGIFLCIYLSIYLLIHVYLFMCIIYCLLNE